jgi:hypothetical protein
MDLSTGHLFASFFVGTIGIGLFIYGKKQGRVPQLLTGITLLVFPYFLESPAWILGIGALTLSGLWLVVRAGL